MTPKEAIEKLQDLKRYAYEPETEKAHKALDLGSEALKAIQLWRQNALYGLPRRLSGETEETGND